ncbi:MAG TPA: pyridoxamine 5'-phosphate oxidase family protein [Acidimicrobiales bacterium]|nr:pyridoxamine 5'-phosphate oxidase family protein [Acidimicrobiales bacterium]
MTSIQDTASGDLARRVAERRAELGLSIDQTARRAGMDPGYLNYVEHNATARLSAGSLILLAAALKTTPEALQGGFQPFPQARGGAGHPSLRSLSIDQCMVHLEGNVYGRVVFTTARGPIALPVNYEFTDGQVIISTDHKKASKLTEAGVVGFEIDHAGEGLSEGWSVLVTGPARQVTAPHERMTLSSLRLESWSGGPEHDLIAIRPKEITGRVIVHPV